MNALKAFAGVALTFAIGLVSTAVGLLLIRHVGPLQRLAGLASPQSQLIDFSDPLTGNRLIAANGNLDSVNAAR